MAKTALIVGSSGLIGGQLLDKLLNSSEYDVVISLVRKSSEGNHKKLQEIVVDFDSMNLTTLEGSVDDVFCCLGTTMKKAGSKEAFKKVDFEYPYNIAKKLKDYGARSFHLISALGADEQSSVFYNKVKGEIETAIKKIEFDLTHIYRPSLLFGNRKEFRLGEKIGILLFRVFNIIMLGPLKKYRGIESSKVAQAMLVNAQNPSTGVFIHESDKLQAYSL